MDSEMRIVQVQASRFAVVAGGERAGRQFGAIARWQLLEMGSSRSRIDHWHRTGRIYRRYPGVYAWGRPDLSTEGELAAALLYAGRGAALTGVSALWWLDLLNRRPALIHVDVPGRKSSRQDIVIRHPAEFRRNWHLGLPVVALPQALLSASDALSCDSLRLVLARAEFGRKIQLRALSAALEDGRRGTRKLRAAMNAHLPQLAACTNGLERDFVLLCERYRLPLPDPNPRIGRFRPDMLWRGAKLIVELDGRDAHSTPAQIAADESRQDELERRGYMVIRLTWAQVHFDADRVAALVRRHLARGDHE